MMSVTNGSIVACCWSPHCRSRKLKPLVGRGRQFLARFGKGFWLGLADGLWLNLADDFRLGLEEGLQSVLADGF
jgi:hypothetical protein